MIIKKKGEKKSETFQSVGRPELSQEGSMFYPRKEAQFSFYVLSYG